MPHSFCEEQRTRIGWLWERMLAHPFLIETRDGEISDETFANWMRQDYLFVKAAIPFLAALIPKAPEAHWEMHVDVIGNLRRELELFRERAGAVGVDLDDVKPAFVNHAYIQFLIATAYCASYAEAYTVLYVAEKAYFDSWSVVKEGLDPDSTWYPFVENWAGDAFAGYVSHLEGELDALAAEAGPAERQRMAELFELTARYEVAFWEMAVTGSRWPGLDGVAKMEGS